VGNENGSYLSRADILAMSDVIAEDVKVDAWGGRPVRVRALTASEAGWYKSQELRAIAAELRDSAKGSAHILALAGQQVARYELRVRLVRMCAIDDGDLPLFEESDEVRLGAMSDGAISQLAAAILRLSKITPAEEAEAVEAAQDFSAGTPASG
jgi:hypothetical protein